MGRMSELSIAIRELNDDVTRARVDSLVEELTTLDFDSQNHTDPDWFKMQDAEMAQSELESIEQQAEIEDMRMNGYA